MKDYYYKDNAFVIENYNTKKPFASFLPGLAGKKGIPLWAFYVNRAQGIAGFGLQDKSKPIMTFTPANKAYESVGTSGFRTFIKADNQYYEAFASDDKHAHRMRIKRASLCIEETHEQLGLQVHVKYFGLPNAPIAALVRMLTIKNVGNETRNIEVLDGITEILPSGVSNGAFQASSNLLASWMDVNHLDENIAFYKLRASTGDSSEVNDISDGNFYIGFTEEGLIKPLVDQQLIFSFNTAKKKPIGFIEQPLQTLMKQPQVVTNHIPCGFIPFKKSLKPGETVTLYALSGHARNVNFLRNQITVLSDTQAIKAKAKEAEAIIESLLNDVDTDTAYPVFNQYIKQNYLDNLLRGGYPIAMGGCIYHLYSRRHGDLERDYNYFNLAPEYYSQGSGNFRDVCQNRRMDAFIHSEVGAFNIRQFASLIQLDGYNPLVVNGMRYTIDDEAVCQTLCQTYFNGNKTMQALLAKLFTPGAIVNTIENHAIACNHDESTYLDAILKASTPHFEAVFGEGYWTDHFTYLLEMIENYEAIYPDYMETLLFEDMSYLYFDSPVTLRAQHEKTVKTDKGTIRQYGALRHYDDEKIKRLKMDPHQSNWVKIDNEPYRSTLYVKLLSIVLNKHSQLDPDGFGIEMEAEKPGWNDAMNGLPGLHGSGVGETIETMRLVDFLLKYHNPKYRIQMPKELNDFFKGLVKTPDYFTRVHLRENYRDAIRFGISGKFEDLNPSLIKDYLTHLSETLQHNLTTLFEHSNGIMPTFLTYEVTEYEPLMKNNQPIIGNYKLPLVKPLAFKRRALPHFLEAPARLLKSRFSDEHLRRMHENILNSDIYDASLNLFKTSACLEGETHEIGRIRAFTKGWLERESNFLHLTYKYLIGLLKAGLYDSYFQALKDNLVCFMNPNQYGRSTLENSSFIVPSNNPNAKLHGQGFFARLSGSTVEMIHMWAIMMTGGNPFTLKNDQLTLSFKPVLSSDFFKDDGTVSFMFMKQTRVTYINKNRRSTYLQCETEKIELSNAQETIVKEGGEISGKLAEAVRNGLYQNIIITLKT